MAAASLGAGHVLGQELLALGQGVGIGRHPLDVAQRGAGLGHQMEVDVHDHFALDVQVDIEDEPVDRGTHGALDGVLQGDETEVNLACGHLLEHGGDGGKRSQVGASQVRLGQ